MDNPLTIAVVGFEQANALDISGPVEVFSTANMLAEAEKYSIALYSIDGEPFTTSANLTMVPEGDINDIPNDIDTLFIAGGIGVESVIFNQPFINWLKVNHSQFNRLASVCTGSFLLAQAGLLDNKSATTHWRACDAFHDMFPKVKLNANAIFTRDGNLYTSAGITTGIDLALSLLEDDYGHELSMQVAKNLVLYLKRSGGQRQFSEILLAQDKNQSDEYPFEQLINWFQDNLAKDIKVESMAEQVGMSQRNFSRKFSQCYGTSPMQFLNQLRLEMSRNLIEQKNQSLTEITSSCGFKSYETMRRQFTQHYGLGPHQYKKRFNLG